MKKAELIAHIAEGSDLTKAQAERALNATTETITKELAENGTVAIIGFGTFKTKERIERQGRNPQTGDAITIPASKNVGFKAGKALKDSLA